MYTEIIKLEEAFNQLLPDKRLNQSPGKELLAAARAWSETVWEVGRQLGPLPLTDEQIEAGINLARHPVYICGVHRSGTTLVRDLLDGHPELCVLPSEGTFLTSVAKHLQRMPAGEHEHFLITEWLWRLANPINQPPYWLIGRTTEQQSPYVDFARAFSAWYAIAEKSFKPVTSSWPHLVVVLAYATCSNGLNAKFWVDKTPALEKYLPTIRREMPEAKVIHVVRNPLDVLLSRKEMEPGLNIKHCLTDMALSYQIATEQPLKNGDRFLLLRYEDLCVAPETALSHVSGFLNIEPDPCLFTPTVAGKAVRPNSSFNPDLPEGKILNEKKVTQNKGLTDSDSALLSAYLFKTASELGYPVKPVGAMKSGLIKLKLGLQSFVHS
jgi:hypothetical protein